jgi:hypothetical protein
MIIKNPREQMGKIINVLCNPFGIYWIANDTEIDSLDWVGLLALYILLIWITVFCFSFTYDMIVGN